MKVLWITNLIAPPGQSVADPQRAVFGGWVANMLHALKETPGLSLSIALRTGGRTHAIETLSGVTHHYVPRSRRDPRAMDPDALRQVLASEAPDILHIEGAEMPHAAQATAVFNGKVVVSIQGILKGLAPYEFGGLPFWRWALTPHRPRRALMAADLMVAKQRAFAPRIATEATTMARAHHVIPPRLLNDLFDPWVKAE